MYGYEPPKQQEPGGCRDALVLTRVAFGVLMPILLFGLGAILFVGVSIALFATHWSLALLPLGAVAAGLLWLARRDRRVQREREEEINRPYRRPPKDPQ